TGSWRIQWWGTQPAISGSRVFLSYACGLADAFDPSGHNLCHVDPNECSGAGAETPAVLDNYVYSPDDAPLRPAGGEIIDAVSGRITGSYLASRSPAGFGGVGYFVQLESGASYELVAVPLGGGTA